MTKLEELVDWLEKQVKDPWGVVPALVAYGNCLAKARQLLAEEKAEEQKFEVIDPNPCNVDMGAREQKATADEELYNSVTKECDSIENLHAYKMGGEWKCGAESAIWAIRRILSRHRPVKVESLAELADRKGYSDVSIQTGGPRQMGANWLIIMQGYSPFKSVVGDTYPAAESAARKFLEGLPDKGEAR